MKNLKLKDIRPDGIAQRDCNESSELSKKFKLSAISAAVTVLVCVSVPSYSADIEIYKIPEDSVGATTIMLMVDISGSMNTNSINADYDTGSDCTIRYDSETANYTRNYCGVSAGTSNKKVTGYWYPSFSDPDRQWVAGCEQQSDASYRCYDRITRLKDGLRQVLEGTPTVKKIDDKIVVGLSSFAGSNGYIRVPARALNAPSGETRQELVTKTRIIEKERDIYGPVEERYLISAAQPAVPPTYATTEITPAYDRIYYQKRSSLLKSDEYRECNWKEKDLACVSFKGWNGKKPEVNVSNLQERSVNCSLFGIFCDTEYYVHIPAQTGQGQMIHPGSPAVDAVYGTRTVQGKIGTETYQEEETYTEWEHIDILQREVLLRELGQLNANGGTPTPYAYAEAAAYLMGTQTHASNDNVSSYSGWSSSTILAKNSPTSPTKYQAPESITSQKDNATKRECSGQGIYFLTDGRPEPGGTAPNDTGTRGTAYTLMNKALGDKGSVFNCASSPLGNQTGGYYSTTNGWSCIGKFTQALLDPAKNPTNLKIQTAVVGFGSAFGAGAAETNDIKDAKAWGILGDGGWISGSSPEDVAKSINDFITTLNKDVPSMSTGSSTIPMDALNPEIIQPYSYFPQFEPKVNPADRQQLWFGNLKKYYVVNGGVYSSQNASTASTVVLKSKLQDLTDIWAKSGVSYPENTPIFNKGGVLSQLGLGIKTNENGTNSTVRKILTEYSYDGTLDYDSRVTRNYNLTQIDHTYTTNNQTKNDNSARVRGLMALLGYDISSTTDTNGLDLTTVTPAIRQMGSVYHSLPVLLTQEGKAVAEKNSVGKIQISTIGRKDYAMFGTTQGLLSVVNANTGIEKFSFLPKEIIEKQAETFRLGAGDLSNGKDALYYGLDGEWTSHTVYVTKSDGTLTVKGASRPILGSTPEENQNFDGKQWVYGGMRMGGRSYYSLDLTDMDNPKLKFHIDPSTGKVYSSANPTGKSFAAIRNMAQSWSKPKLDYVNWKGQRKLVMFVGGGYDAGGADGDGLYVDGIRTGYSGYEKYNYVQNNKKGSGVYMFDADTGDLLWYAASAQLTEESQTPVPENGQNTTTESIAYTTHADLKYSVASDIKTVDRNNDGMIDHLYFGDLAGQAFRVDFDRNLSNFNSKVTKILDLHETNGTSPRFYMSPTFTAHHSAHRKEGANVVVASFISGNKSSPLLATIDSPTTTGVQSPLGLQYDAVYAIYDYDIHPNGQFYPGSNTGARKLAIATEATSQSKLKLISHSSIVRNDTDAALVKGAVANPDSGWGGWYYKFDKKFDGNEALQSIVKGIVPLVAMEGSLYVTMYDASNNGTTTSCGAGVKGHSFTQRLCLPTGVCPENANYKYNLGAGIINLNVGSVDGSNIKSIVVPDPDDIGTGCTGTDCKSGKKFITAGGSIRFIPNRWYERYGKVD